MGCLPTRLTSAPAKVIGVTTAALIGWGSAMTLATTPASGGPARRPTSLCMAGEQPLFACPIGRKLVSVCSSGRGATYRFGTPAKVELLSTALSYARTWYSGGGEAQISFSNNGVRYIVYDRAVRTSFDGHNDTQFSAGVLIQKDGRTISNARCLGEEAIGAGAESVLPKGTFVYHD